MPPTLATPLPCAATASILEGVPTPLADERLSSCFPRSSSSSLDSSVAYCSLTDVASTSRIATLQPAAIPTTASLTMTLSLENVDNNEDHVISMPQVLHCSSAAQASTSAARALEADSRLSIVLPLPRPSAPDRACDTFGDEEEDDTDPRQPDRCGMGCPVRTPTRSGTRTAAAYRIRSRGIRSI